MKEVDKISVVKMNALFSAIKKKDFDLVKSLVQPNGENPAFLWNDLKVRSSFHMACEHFHREILEFLVKEASQATSDLSSLWHQRDSGKRFPHHLLAMNRESQEEVTATFRFLEDFVELELGAIDQFGETALDKAQSVQNESLIQYLQKFTGGNSLMVWEAISNDDVEWIRNNMKPHEVNMEGPHGTCLQYAIKLNSTKTVLHLLNEEHIDVNLASNANPYPPVFEAATNLRVEVFAKLIARGDLNITQKIFPDAGKSMNILHALIASKKAYDEAIDWAEKAIDWNLLTDTYTMLEQFFATRSKVEIAKLINDQDLPRKNTPLHYATEHHGQALAKLLLQHGAEKSLFVLNKNEDIPISHMDTETVREFLNKQIHFQGLTTRADFKLTLQTDYFFPHLNETKDCDMEMMTLDEQKQAKSRRNIPELDYLGRIKDVHRDLFDHPIISSVIWRKWQKIWRFFVVLSAIKLLQHLCGIAYVMSAYGGASLYCNYDEGTKTTGASVNLFCSRTCCPDTFRHYSWLLFMGSWILNLLRSGFILMILAKKDMSITMGNWGTVWEQGESKLTACNNLVIVPLMICTKSNDPFNRDVSGFYILVACFDICFILRNHLTNRTLAAMITWTEVVSRSIFNFFKVHVIILLGFMLTFYIQLHDDFLDEHGHEQESESPFHFYYRVPLKTFAMFVGELEYGDFPFQSGKFLVFNHLTFLFFVYFIVLVMMNLLTGMALMDVQEISNASSDLTWMEMMVKINYIEEFLVTQKMLRWGKRFKVFANENSRKLVLYPNRKRSFSIKKTFQKIFCRGKIAPNSDVLVTEESINSEAKKIILELVAEEERETFNMLLSKVST